MGSNSSVQSGQHSSSIVDWVKVMTFSCQSSDRLWKHGVSNSLHVRFIILLTLKTQIKLRPFYYTSHP